MNFSNAGWLEKYLAIRGENPFPSKLPSTGMRVLEQQGQHHQLDEAIYYFLQPTGLLYGFPVQMPFSDFQVPGMEFWNAFDRGHLIFLEAMFACLVADRSFLLDGLVEESHPMSAAVDCAMDFFSGISTRSRRKLPGIPLSLSRRKSSPQHRAFEKEIRHKIEGSFNYFGLPGMYYNSFLFLDLYSCMLWQRRMLMEPEQRDTHLQFLKEEQVWQRRELILYMIAAAVSSGAIEPEEHKLIDWFIRSSGLDKAERNTLQRHLKEGVSLADIDSRDMPWLVRRFILEAVMMTILVDRDISVEERDFLDEAVEKLQLWSNELEQARVALEVFMLNQENDLHILRNRAMVFDVGETLRNQATLMLRKNLSRIVNEIRETQDLYNLLLKSTQSDLTPEEKARVKAQLTDILKTIPAVAIWALPGGGFALPILIKLLPFNLLPSSFED